MALLSCLPAVFAKKKKMYSSSSMSKCSCTDVHSHARIPEAFPLKSWWGHYSWMGTRWERIYERLWWWRVESNVSHHKVIGRVWLRHECLKVWILPWMVTATITYRVKTIIFERILKCSVKKEQLDSVFTTAEKFKAISYLVDQFTK